MAVAYLVVIFSPLLLFFALGLLAIFGSHHVPKGQCHGIGWGCQMTTSEDAELAAVVFGLPNAVVQILVGCGVLALLRPWKAYRGLPVFAQGLIPSTPMFVLAIVVLGYH